MTKWFAFRFYRGLGEHTQPVHLWFIHSEMKFIIRHANIPFDAARLGSSAKWNSFHTNRSMFGAFVHCNKYYQQMDHAFSWQTAGLYTIECKWHHQFTTHAFFNSIWTNILFYWIWYCIRARPAVLTRLNLWIDFRSGKTRSDKTIGSETRFFCYEFGAYLNPFPEYIFFLRSSAPIAV